MTNFTDLPLDILLLIFPHLSPTDFLHLAATCKSLSDPSIRFTSSYWSIQTRSKFRVPNRPIVAADGLRWQRLYKRLQTQTRIYTWGQNTYQCLGRGTNLPRHGRIQRRGQPPRLPRAYVQPLSPSGDTWPEEATNARHLGIIADLQCGGWSTSVLNDKGIIYTVGILDGIHQYASQSEFKPLKFPGKYSDITPHTAIRQFSSGRTHVLGLSDDGTIWSWADVQDAGTNIALSDLEYPVRSVVAGWNKSSAYLPGHGIVIWGIVPSSGNTNSETSEIHDWMLVPRSGYRRLATVNRQHEQRPPSSVSTTEDVALGESVGEVASYIILEHYAIFVTDTQKAFAYRIRHDIESGVLHDIFELTEVSGEAQDVQGSFRTFAILGTYGKVVIANQDYLDAWSRRTFSGNDYETPRLQVIPALQDTGVMQLAFGDYHYHALHSDGSITSYGYEPDGSGALGLGGALDIDLPHGMLRSIKQNPWNRDGVLLPHAYSKGRRIWFQKEKELWVRFLATGGRNKEEAQERMRMVGSMPPLQGEVSEWIEQMGSHWDKRPQVGKVDEDGLGAHFALSVAAAGWHSGALVLVNEKVVQAVRESCLVSDSSERDDKAEPHTDASSSHVAVPPVIGQPAAESMIQSMSNLLSRVTRQFLGLPNYADLQGDEQDQVNDDHSESPPKGKRWIWTEQDFPRLKLDNGLEMPGDAEFSTWKEEKPDWKLRWTGEDRNSVFGVKGWALEE